MFLTPTMKLYHTLLVLFVYLPALWLVISRPASLKQLLHERIEARLFPGLAGLGRAFIVLEW